MSILPPDEGEMMTLTMRAVASLALATIAIALFLFVRKSRATRTETAVKLTGLSESADPNGATVSGLGSPGTKAHVSECELLDNQATALYRQGDYAGAEA